MTCYTVHHNTNFDDLTQHITLLREKGRQISAQIMVRQALCIQCIDVIWGFQQRPNGHLTQTVTLASFMKWYISLKLDTNYDRQMDYAFQSPSEYNIYDYRRLHSTGQRHCHWILERQIYRGGHNRARRYMYSRVDLVLIQLYGIFRPTVQSCSTLQQPSSTNYSA